MLAARTSLSDKMLSDIAEVSLLRYADQLAPAAFGDYLNSGPDGTFIIHRLPAEDDPMLERIERIRRVEYVVTDTMDEQYRNSMPRSRLPMTCGARIAGSSPNIVSLRRSACKTPSWTRRVAATRQ